MIITDAIVEVAAKAAWMEYTGLTSFEKWRDDMCYDDDDPKARTYYDMNVAEWPTNTGLYPDADNFRACARAALTAAIGANEP